MGRLSAKLRGMDGMVAFWCPGCASTHVVNLEREYGPAWGWDKNGDAPTFTPSILVSTHDKKICHSFVKAGQIEFLSDCTHALAGQTVPMPDWPYAEGEYGGV